MAVEQPNTLRDSTLRDTPRPTMIPLPGDQLVTTEGLIKQLQIPDAVALQPGNLIPFLANQSARLLEITSRPEIKTQAAEIPEYIDDPRAPAVTALSSDEQTALSQWRDERSALLRTQSGDGDLDALEKEIQTYIDDAVKNNPDLFGNGGSGSFDVIDQYVTGQMVEMNDEQKKKYQELMMLASRGADPESVLLALTYKNAQSSMNRIGQMLNVYKEQTGILDKLRADLDLKGFKGDLSQAEMMKTNMDFSRTQADVMNLFQIMQKEMNRYETVLTSANSLGKSLNESLRGTIANFKAS